MPSSAEQARRRGRDALAQAAPRRRRIRARGAANDLQDRDAACPACCPACRSRSRRRRAAAGCASPSWPHSARPFVHSSACCRGELVGRHALRARSSSSTHGAKSSGRRVRETSAAGSPRSPFGSITIAGMPSIAASSSSVEAEARLAAAGHADAHRVRHEVARVVQQSARPSPSCPNRLRGRGRRRRASRNLAFGTSRYEAGSYRFARYPCRVLRAACQVRC